MTKPWMVCTAVAAFAGGMTLVHCSGTTTPLPGATDGGAHDAHVGTGTSSGTGTGTAAGSSTGSGSSVTSGTGSSPGSSTGSGTSASSGTGSAPGSSTGSGSSDTYDAGPCVGPSGGESCDPGNVECGSAQCAVPQNECCLGTGNSASCLAPSASCAGNEQACDEKSDCPDGQICCLKVTDINGDFKISCQTGTTCPTGGLASAQICKTNAECSTGSCSLYSCQGNTTEACQAPNAICSKM
jgi:hypothetical protein